MKRLLRGLAAALLAAAALGGCAPADQLPGKLTVAAFFVPPDLLAKAALQRPDDAAGPGWTSPLVLIETQNNPHRLVVDFEGVLTGDPATAQNLFEVTWLIKQDEQTGGPMQLVHFAKGNLKIDGSRVSGRAVTPPLSFRQPDKAALNLQLSRHTGLTPTKLTLSVRAGMEGNTWVQTLISFQSLLVGLVFLALILWFRR